jgi:O-methyltransferase
MLQTIRRAARAARAVLSPVQRPVREQFPEATDVELDILEKVRPYTMTSRERLWGLLKAVQYVVARRIPGDIVECGVWRGGSAMAAALALKDGGDDRTIWLYDTFQGMPAPTAEDSKMYGDHAGAKFAAKQDGEFSDWCRASLEDVKDNFGSTGHTNVRYVQGKVEETLLSEFPESVALLRLDTDWYVSTKAELEILWPRLSPGGILILDDYGSWGGAKKAVDEFFADKPALLLNRLDYTGRLAIKS